MMMTMIMVMMKKTIDDTTTQTARKIFFSGSWEYMKGFRFFYLLSDDPRVAIEIEEEGRGRDESREYSNVVGREVQTARGWLKRRPHRCDLVSPNQRIGEHAETIKQTNEYTYYHH